MLAADVLALPFLQDLDSNSVSAIAWSDGQVMTSAERRSSTCEFGAEILHREVMGDKEWSLSGSELYSISQVSVEAVVELSYRRFNTAHPQETLISSALLRELVPENAPHREAGLGLLRDMRIAIQHS